VEQPLSATGNAQLDLKCRLDELCGPATHLLASAYTARTRERLVELKRQYDPTNFFRLNANISV